MDDSSLNFESPAPGSNAILEQPPLPAESTSPSQETTGQTHPAEGKSHRLFAFNLFIKANFLQTP